MSVNEIVMDRSEFVNYLAERVEDPSDVAKALRFIESAFILQNDAHRPAYVFSVSEKIAEEDMEVIRNAFVELGVLGVFLPSTLMEKVSYDGTVTPDSLGVGRR